MAVVPIASDDRRPRPRQRLEVLDGVRFLAAAYVVVFHFSAGDRGSWHAPSRTLFAPLFSIASYGWLGVELFFMISGFVICLSAWGKTFEQFAVSRFIRLYPAYWFGILLTTIVVLIDQSRAHALAWQHVVENFTMTQSWAGVPAVDPSYWTLAIELNFYLLVALVLVSWGFTYFRVVMFGIVWLAVSLLDAFTVNYWYEVIVQPVYVPFFVAGIVLYLIHRFGPSAQLWTLLALCWACSMYRLVNRTAVQHPSGVTLNYWVAASIVTGFFVVLALIALGKLALIRGRWLVTAGALTYPLYLLHQQIGETVIRSLDPWVPSWLLLGLVFAAMLALSWLVHRYAERPVAARLRAALRARRTPVAAMSAAGVTVSDSVPRSVSLALPRRPSPDLVAATTRSVPPSRDSLSDSAADRGLT
ncbi:MAG TPA: acyltransferase [Micromonosporaceae bacterium]|nr:acyltransferase [Micromonosporaceae bacterium]